MKKNTAVFFSILVFALGFYLIVKDFHKEQVKIWDEASSAKNAIEMLANNEFIVQYDDGEPVRDDFKPPLSLWLKMLCYSVFGINEFSVRLPSILAALLTMFFLWYYGFFVLKRHDLGIISALLLVSSRGYVGYHVARTGDPDALLVLFIALAVILLFHLFWKYPQNRNRYYWFIGGAITLAMYTKGIMGLAPLVGIGLFFITQKKGRQILSDYRLYLTGFIAISLTGLYYITREALDPGFLQGVLKYEILSFREAPAFVKHPEFSFYINYLYKEGFHPFFYLAPVPFLAYFLTKNNLFKQLILFSFFGSAVFLLGMSAATLKNEWYISPIYPYLVLFISTGLIGLKEIFSEKFYPGHGRTIGIIFSVLIFLLVFQPIRKIDKANHRYRYEVYHPEREGRFFDNIKKRYPEIKEIAVITPHHIRQLQFYTKKYEYLDQTETHIYQKVPEDMTEQKVIVCDQEKLFQFSRKYNFELIDKDEYCYLMKVTGERKTSDSLLISCNASVFSPDSMYFLDPANPNVKFSNPGFSEKTSFSGPFSVVMNPQTPYGFTTNLSFAEPYYSIEMSVWAKSQTSEGYLVISIPGIDFYHQSKKISETQGEWRRISLRTFIPPVYEGEEIKVYVWNNSNGKIYFDALSILLK